MSELVTWLRGVLDEAEEVANDEWSGPDLQRRQAIARVEAERMLLERAVFERENAQDDRDLSHDADQWETAVQLIAYGRRFDSPGWREEWRPLGALPLVLLD